MQVKAHNDMCFTLKSGYIIVQWHTDPLLGNDCETNNDTTVIARQQLCKYATVLEPLLGSGPHTTMEVLLEAVFSMVLLQGYITRLTELR
jgi:hypothetical protein